MLKINTLKNAAPRIRVGYFFMLFCMFLICVPTSKGAIVNGDFEDNADLSGAIASAPLTNWSPTPVGTAIVIGTDPFFHNSNFNSLLSGGTPGGSISALFLNDQGVKAPVNSLASISQSITTVPGQFYDIHFWVANLSTTITGAPDLSARENLFSVSWNGAPPVDLTIGNAIFSIPNPLNPNAVELAGAPGTYVLSAAAAWTLVTISNVQATGTSTTLTISAKNNNNATAVDAVDVTPEPSSIVLLIAGAAFAGTRRRRQQRAA